MDRRASRVSERQWDILIDYLECNPNLARARGYNNSARGRAESSRKWSQVAELLNAEGSGVTKTPKEWSIYVSNFKSKLKKTVAEMNAEILRTGGGPPSQGLNLSSMETRFLSLMGEGFGQSYPGVAVNPLPEMTQTSTAPAIEDQEFDLDGEQPTYEVLLIEGPDAHDMLFNVNGDSDEPQAQTETLSQSPSPAAATTVSLPRRTRRARYRSRPLAPLDEAQRVLSRVELQRAAADMANAQANNLMAQNLGRLASAVERYLAHIGVP